MQLPIEEERLDDLDMDHLLRLKAVSESQVSEQENNGPKWVKNSKTKIAQINLKKAVITRITLE